MLTLFARRPPAVTQPTPAADVGLLDQQAMAEYREVAKQVGLAADDVLDIEALRHFLDRHDLPIFNRAEVVRYMDQITARTNPTGYGWEWRPVRAKDAQIGVTLVRRAGSHPPPGKRLCADAAGLLPSSR